MLRSVIKIKKTTKKEFSNFVARPTPTNCKANGDARLASYTGFVALPTLSSCYYRSKNSIHVATWPLSNRRSGDLSHTAPKFLRTGFNHAGFGRLSNAMSGLHVLHKRRTIRNSTDVHSCSSDKFRYPIGSAKSLVPYLPYLTY